MTTKNIRMERAVNPIVKVWHYFIPIHMEDPSRYESMRGIVTAMQPMDERQKEEYSRQLLEIIEENPTDQELIQKAKEIAESIL